MKRLQQNGKGQCQLMAIKSGHYEHFTSSRLSAAMRLTHQTTMNSKPRHPAHDYSQERDNEIPV
jgi:hypothetical protein